ncbi:MAG TPA: HD domain-containing protein [Bryobacteraceae bacterium]|jgi:phosphonate degradation associated HDIG domain protein|nr:HD domain-containing protein [Bryobacteraceae bacterium]
MRDLRVSERVVGEVLALLENSAGAAYYGEPVTQLEHALQCAQLARDAGASAEMVASALLHDIGHLLETETAQRHEEIGVVNHDDVGAAYLLERGFSPRVAELVRGHVDAKRYLTTANPSYASKLSGASAATLALQGGPMTPEEAAAFQRDPLFAEKLRLRSWDEQAKRPGWQVASLESYRDLLLQQLS